MQKILLYLSKTPVIIMSFLLMNLLWVPFGLVQQAIGGQLLDLLSTSEAGLARLAELSPEQKTIHIWCSILIDTLYPLATAAFIAGLSWRLAKSWPQARRWGCLIFGLAAGLILSDLAENTMHVIALNGQASALSWKDILTPLKLVAYGASSLLLIGIVVAAMARRIKAKRRN